MVTPQILKKLTFKMWTGLNCFRTDSSGGCIWTWLWTLGFNDSRL